MTKTSTTNYLLQAAHPHMLQSKQLNELYILNQSKSTGAGEPVFRHHTAAEEVSKWKLREVEGGRHLPGKTPHSCISIGFNPLERFRVRVKAGAELLQWVYLMKNPDHWIWSSFHLETWRLPAQIIRSNLGFEFGLYHDMIYVLVQSRRMSLRGETGPFTESHPQ
jgi:hypothetical protein